MILDKFKLDGRVALVTGASSGIGQAIAIRLAEAGAQVACHARRAGGAEETISRISAEGGAAFEVTGDMADPAVAMKIVEQTASSRGGIDILVNNAGMIRRAPAAEYSEDDWSTVIDVNLSS